MLDCLFIGSATKDILMMVDAPAPPPLCTTAHIASLRQSLFKNGNAPQLLPVPSTGRTGSVFSRLWLPGLHL